MARSHIERLEEFRTVLVAARRDGVRNVHHARDAMVSSGFQIANSEGAKYGAELKAIQEEIEAVDRAIQDERRLAVLADSEHPPAEPNALREMAQRLADTGT
jgi:hypothetical protein